ncbi:hypothetical protein NC653_033105 [Populus alba x Populus x berolinensis]|uniref:Uncharacterized protein n=1 Tax=Populus alba x Populus x berolinensis TaxID=444605 RepID=A0AAD6LT86_9ROSI|nr:hypothetical protein NC653_033105 [Populus alba x Populus x berolinensis]
MPSRARCSISKLTGTSAVILDVIEAISYDCYSCGCGIKSCVLDVKDKLRQAQYAKRAVRKTIYVTS